MNIFERASRAKLRIPTMKGSLTVEQLWDLPLVVSNGLSLDMVARAISRELKDQTEESFVDIKPDPRRTELELTLDILKHIIESKKLDAARAETIRANAEKRRKLMEILERKENSELEGKTKEELLKELEALGG